MISSRMTGFQQERQAAHKAIVAAGMDPWEAETPLIPTMSPEDLCLLMAHRCDVYLLIMGYSYGSLPSGQPAGRELSATEMEFEWARQKSPGKVMVFVQDGASDTPDERQRALIRRVLHWSRGTIAHFFTTPAELEAKVTGALEKWQERHSLGLRRYLDVLADVFGTISNPLTEVEIPTEVTIPLLVRSYTRGEVEKQLRYRRPSWDAISAMRFQQREARVDYLRRTFGASDNYGLFPQAVSDAATQSARSDISSVDDFLARFHRLVILGDPGAGKSTLLRRVTHQSTLAALSAESDLDRPIPVYVTAQDLSGALAEPSLRAPRPDPVPLTEALDAVLQRTHFIDPKFTVRFLLARGSVLLLVDGLDEIGGGDRAVLYQALRRDIGSNSAILASRPSVFSERNLPDWRVCEVQQLDAHRQHSLIEQVLKQMVIRGAAPTSRDPAGLERELRNRRDLRVWAGNPMLLTLLATHYARVGQLPDDKAKIYRFALDQLIDSPYRKESMPEQLIERDRLETMLRTLALRMTAATTTTITRTAIARLASGTNRLLSKDIVHELLKRAAVLQLESAKRWRFVHLTFQEYLAASALASVPMGRLVPFIVRRRLSARWEQVTQQLVCELDRLGRHADADTIVRALIKADGKRIKGMYRRDPLHLALARATRCQRGRTPRAQRSATAQLSTELTRRWQGVWRTRVRIKAGPIRAALLRKRALSAFSLEQDALITLGADIVPDSRKEIRREAKLMRPLLYVVWKAYGPVLCLTLMTFLLIPNSAFPPAMAGVYLPTSIGSKLGPVMLTILLFEAFALPVLSLLVFGHYDRRLSAIERLERLGPAGRGALPDLEAVAHSSNPTMRRAARTAMQRILGSPQSWTSSETASRKKSRSRVFSTDGHLPPLALDRLYDSYGSVRARAIRERRAVYTAIDDAGA